MTDANGANGASSGKADDAVEIDRLAALDPMEYDRCRGDEAARRARRDARQNGRGRSLCRSPRQCERAWQYRRSASARSLA